ncbi:MAG: lipocalin-like domain-containing protein [Bacteroidota bacterium]|nr:lipocalin-like domain-containing protein [Bacteroidota bacterium]MDP3144384.1 lipocalin-like domain-containing protein [Bacteroidota bacterium]MDP3555938.1 lipocalin-like domain-containing protein [Bacteroidota bacterium]
MKIIKLLSTAILISISLTSVGQKKVTNTNTQFKGLWILDKYETRDTVSGKWSNEPNRMGYVGYILFDGIGHVAIQITPADYHEFDINKKGDSTGMKVAEKYHSNNLIYFADYKVDGNTMEHKVISSTNPESIGAILMRDFEIIGKTLFLTPRNKLNGSKIRMKWVKVP